MNNKKVHKHRKKIICVIIVFIFAALLIGGRIYLPHWAKDYVNGVISGLDGYTGGVDDIDIQLYRGAYTIHGIKILKRTNSAPAPFFKAETIDISIEWKALFNGRIVSEFDVKKPEINVAVDKKGDIQTGEGANWNEAIKDLTPFDINRASFTNGKLSYKNYATSPNVDLYIDGMQADIKNLRNVEDKNDKLPSTITVSGESIGTGKLRIDGRLNILTKFLDMDIDLKLENAKLSAINNYSKAFAAIDFEGGTLSVFSEVMVLNNQISGYIKPIANDVKILDFKKESNPLKIAWEAIAGTMVEVFSNQPKDQFATKVEISGDLNNIKTSTLDILWGIVKNAFVKALTKTTDNTVGLPERLKSKSDDKK